MLRFIVVDADRVSQAGQRSNSAHRNASATQRIAADIDRRVPTPVTEESHNSHHGDTGDFDVRSVRRSQSQGAVRALQGASSAPYTRVQPPDVLPGTPQTESFASHNLNESLSEGQELAHPPAPIMEENGGNADRALNHGENSATEAGKRERPPPIKVVTGPVDVKPQ